MKNKSLYNLGLALLFLFSSLGAISLYGYFSSKVINESTKTNLSNQETYFKVHGGIHELLNERSTLMHQMINTTDAGERDKLKAGIEAQRIRLKEYQKLCVHPHITPKPNMFTRQGQAVANFSKVEDKFLSIIDNNYGEAHKFYTEEVLPERNKVLKVVEKGTAHIRDNSKKVNFQFINQNKSFIETNLFINILVVLLSIMLFYVLFRSLKASNKKIYHQARTDSLTKLTNREEFLRTANDHIVQYPDYNFAIAILDIDYFKSINDTHGHNYGDSVLISFANKVSSKIDEACILSRIGGDEFALLIKDTGEEQTNKIIKELSNSLQYTHKVDNTEIPITSSIGVSQYPKDGKTIKDLIDSADQAMYLSKKSGRNTFRFYTEELRDMERIDKENTQKLKSILEENNENNNLYLVFQPLLNCSNSSDGLKECEALLRWKDDDGNNIPPDEFIPLSEKTNLIFNINKFVINEVCKQQKNWQDQPSLEDIRVNINLSGSKGAIKDLLDTLTNNIQELGLNPKLFGIEITERTLFDVSDSTILALEKIRDMGMKISIDDFGTGYSSFAYLNKLPITTLKIDKVFIDEVTENVYSQKIVGSIIALGHSLGLDIVAEGVETKKQLAFLKSKSCNSIQGYFYKKPLPVAEIDSYLYQEI